MRPPDLQFWVTGKIRGKAYKQQWRDGFPGKQYLSPKSRSFETAVRECCAEAGSYLMDFTKVRIDIYWPIRVKGKRKMRIEYPLNHPDASNIQKSVEDAIKRWGVDRKLASQKRVLLKYLKLVDEDPIHGQRRDDYIRDLAKVEAAIEVWKKAHWNYGAVMIDDNRTLDIHTTFHWRHPDATYCVRVSVWEVQPEEYHTKELTEWLRNQ